MLAAQYTGDPTASPVDENNQDGDSLGAAIMRLKSNKLVNLTVCSVN